MRDIILIAGACAVYTAYCVYTATMTGSDKHASGNSLNHASSHHPLFGIDWRCELNVIETALQQEGTGVICLTDDRLQLSLASGIRCGTHVREGLRRFLGRRLVIVWHLTETMDARDDIRRVLVLSLLRLVPATNCRGQPLNWGREWRDALGTQAERDAKLAINRLLDTRATAEEDCERGLNEAI